MTPPPPRSTLFPYTTLFRSDLSRWLDGVAPEDLDRVSHAAEVLTEAGTYQVEYRMTRPDGRRRSEEHTSELQSRRDLVCRLLLEKKKLLFLFWCAVKEYGID